MRKIISFSFIAVLFINLFGYFISFTIQRHEIRAEVKQLLKQEKHKHTQQFVFTQAEYNQLSQCDGGTEFSFNGCMYDVVKKELKAGKIIITAYYDHQETGLLDKLVAFFDEENSSSEDNETPAAFSLLEFVSPHSDWKCHNTLTRLPLYHSNPHFLSQLSADLVSPPPDLFFS